MFSSFDWGSVSNAWSWTLRFWRVLNPLFLTEFFWVLKWPLIVFLFLMEQITKFFARELFTRFDFLAFSIAFSSSKCVENEIHFSYARITTEFINNSRSGLFVASTVNSFISCSRDTLSCYLNEIVSRLGDGCNATTYLNISMYFPFSKRINQLHG